MEQSREFTSSEIALALNISEVGVRQIGHRMNLEKVTATRNGKSYPAWTYEGFLQIKNWVLMRRKMEAEARKEETKISESIEDLKKKHPLVKDVRFFRTSYFPDVNIEEE